MNSNPKATIAQTRNVTLLGAGALLPILALGALMTLGTGASAHDVWSNGEPVPA